MVSAAIDTTERYVEREIAAYQNDPEFRASGWALAIAGEAVSLLQAGRHNQTWLADQMGVSRSHVSAILTAPPNMTLLTLAKLAVALGVPAEVSLNSNWNTPRVRKSRRKA